MQSRPHRSGSPTSRSAFRSQENDPAFSAPPRSSPRAVASSRPSVVAEGASTSTEPPIETDAWWLSRSGAATFARRRITLAGEHARALRATGASRGSLVIEFNGASFEGATISAHDGRYELDLGDALAAEMATVLDEDDGLAVELVTGRPAPTLAIHPYVSAER
ncbi:MAG: hypothetical protein ABJE95_08290 [Byssovorax sp.]